jgi:hypothetical protein
MNTLQIKHIEREKQNSAPRLQAELKNHHTFALASNVLARQKTNL